MDFSNRTQHTQRQHQRFSWQPVPEGNAPAYEQVQRQPIPQGQYQVPAPTHTDTTSDAQNRHFSYAQTPVEHEAFFYVPSPTAPPLPALPHMQQMQQAQQVQSPCTPIDPRPQSMLNPLTTAPSQLQQQAYGAPSSQSRDEKTPISPVYTYNSPHPQSFPDVQATTPQARDYQQYQQPSQPPQVALPQNNHARKMSGLSPINTNVSQYPLPPIPPTPPSINATSPLPQKAPMTPISPDALDRKAPTRDNRQSYAAEPYSPHGFTNKQTSNLHAIFSPDAATGPNGLDFATHQPGQISHPNMSASTSPTWTHSLCSCSPQVSDCMTGLFCPCILYGRTSYRLSQKSAKKDPTDMLGHSTINGHCMLMGLTCVLGAVFPMIQRKRIRGKYKIEGSCLSDALTGCCCCCCVAVQNEREVRSREEKNRRLAGPVSGDVYGRVDGMKYAPQGVSMAQMQHV